MQKRKCLLLINCLFFSRDFCIEDPPRLTVIFVVDQMAYFYIPQLSPYFKSGLKTLVEKGVNFSNAYFPHGMPSTATGHAGLATGTYAKDHGWIGNGWWDKGEYVHCDDDTRQNTKVFSKNGTHVYGKSAKNIMVGGIADKYLSYGSKNKTHHVYSVSLKSRAAIPTAGRLGKAIWFDNHTGYFTTSKAYYSSMPDWLNNFNATQSYQKDNNLVWKPIYEDASPAYAAVNELTYCFARYDYKLVGKNIAPKLFEDKERPYDLWVKSPFANQALIDLSKLIIDQHITQDNTDEMMLWVCLSSLDKVGHFYGPDSKEAIDLIYHMDKQLGEFMDYIEQKVGEKNALFVFTGDHGIMPFVEILNMRGELEARRISIKEMIEEINKNLEEKHGLKNFVTHFKVPHFYVDHKQLKKHNNATKKKILREIADEIALQPGIKKVWTSEELKRESYAPDNIENFFKLQMYPMRSGDIIVQTLPNNVLTNATNGTSHKNPYEENTHVPLILYQPSRFENKYITEKVWALQLTNTLSEILCIPKATASTFEVLPGVFPA